MLIVHNKTFENNFSVFSHIRVLVRFPNNAFHSSKLFERCVFDGVSKVSTFHSGFSKRKKSVRFQPNDGLADFSATL